MFRKRWAIETSYRMINQLQFFYTMGFYELKVTVQHVMFLLMIEALISNIYVKIFR